MINRKTTLEQRIARLEKSLSREYATINENRNNLRCEAYQGMPDDVVEGTYKYLTEIIPREKVWTRKRIRDYIGAINFTNHVYAVLDWFGYSREEIEANKAEIEDMVLNWVSGKRI